MDAVSMIALGVVAGLLIIGGLSYCYSIRDTSEELRSLAEAVQKSIDFMQTRFDGFAVRMKALEDRVERLEGLMSKPLTRVERFFPDMIGECTKEDE